MSNLCFATYADDSFGSIISNVVNYLNDRVLGFTEDANIDDGIFIPNDDRYVDIDGEVFENYDWQEIANKNRDLNGIHLYMNPKTSEVYIFNRKGVHYKNGNPLILVSKASEYQGRKVTLNKPFRTPDGPKKMSVYVKNEKGNVVKVNFGDPNMKIKKNIPERRRSFRARHNCDNPGPKYKALYWSCKAW